MAIELVFETHSTTVDNEQGCALPLAARPAVGPGSRAQARRLGDHRRRNGMLSAELHADRREHLDRPYPGGESWRQAVARVGRFPDDLPPRWDGQRVLVIGHVATR